MNKKQQRRESHAGFHFYNLYQNCPRKFYLKYCMRLMPKYTSYALVHGAAFHEGKAVFYSTKSEKKALKKLEREIEDRRGELEDAAQVDRMLERGHILLQSWMYQQGFNDLKNFKVFEVEKQHHLYLGEDKALYITVRPDTILETQNGDLIIMETKTTGFSYKTTAIGVQAGDQATSYYAAVKAKYPDRNVLYVQPDISYWSSRSDNIDTITHYRADPVMRSSREIDDWQMGLHFLINDITQRVQLVQDGKARAEAVFPRNTSWCNSFSKPCEYIDICRQTKVSGKGRAPAGFRRDTRQRLAIIDPVWDRE